MRQHQLSAREGLSRLQQPRRCRHLLRGRLLSSWRIQRMQGPPYRLQSRGVPERTAPDLQFGFQLCNSLKPTQLDHMCMLTDDHK